MTLGRCQAVVMNCSPAGVGLVVLVDDLRSFADGTPAVVARTSAEAVHLLDHQLALTTIDELWLDHDLGGEDSIWPVIERLEERAFTGRRLEVGRVYVHSGNPVGAQRMVVALRRLGYPVSPAFGVSRLRYDDAVGLHDP